ncbi:hypothetical protein BC833DRAFT_530963 [Globomyces pollinis-pini]|nr:hypothetical protein BC833DRAFT_530963 [Globomyces pollinis-pini]
MAKPPTLVDGMNHIEWKNLTLQKAFELPCARQALITGLSLGGLLTIARLAVNRNWKSAGNWGVLSFGISSAISWEFCRFQRKVSQEQIKKMAEYQKIQSQ